jgi:hypothetical protein
VIDVGHVEGVPIKRTNCRALVHVDVLDAQFAANLEVAVRPRVVELVTAGIPVPFGGVELDALQVVLLGVRPQLLQAASAFRGSKLWL